MPRAFPACSKRRMREAQVSSKAYSIASMIVQVTSLLLGCINSGYQRFK